jgi:hypothetical protein
VHTLLRLTDAPDLERAYYSASARAHQPTDRFDLGKRAVIFPSTAGTLRDPNNFGKEWRSVREELGVPDVTTHSFRKLSPL